VKHRGNDLHELGALLLVHAKAGRQSVHSAMLGGWTALNLIAFGEEIGPCNVVPPVILKPVN
jgi:hypothetical protein